MDINYFDNPFYLILKFLLGGAFQQAWNKARLNKNRYFWFNGKTYNTKKSGESDLWWANHFKDNSTTGGASNVLTDVGLTAGWLGHKGANIGRYNSKGKWIRMKTNTGYHGKTVLGDRGDDVRLSDTRVFGRMDRPNENIVTKKGTNKRVQSANTKTKVSVGTPYPHILGFVFGGYPLKLDHSYSYDYMPGGYVGQLGGTFNNNPIVPHEKNNIVQAKPIRIPFYE